MIANNLIIYDNKVVCPRCDGNGFLYMTTLQPINKSIIICDECEAMWSPDITSISNTNFKDFTIYIKRFGYTYDEITLTDTNYNLFEQ